MSARSGSLGWVVIAGSISLVIAGAMWGLLDSQFVDVVITMESWQAPQGSIPAQGREYVVTTWDWFLLIIVLRVGLEALVASRLGGASTSLPLNTMVLFITHLFLIIWMAFFPEIGAAFYEQSQNASVASNYQTGPELAFQWGIGVIPAVLLLVTDVWYLSEPIRNDLLRS